MGTLPSLRHNPGDLRHSPHSQHPGQPDDIGTIDTDEHGWADLERQLQLMAARGLTLRECIYRWAPKADGNRPDKYLEYVVAGFYGLVGPETPLRTVLSIPAK